MNDAVLESTPLATTPAATPAARLLAWIDAKRWWFFGLAALLHLASFSGVWRVGPDSAVYRGAARNAAAGLGLVFNEQPYTHGFAGFPLLLSWMQRAFGDAAWPSVLVVHLMGLFAIACTFVMLRRHCGRPIAVLVTFAFAANSTLVRHCGELLADVPFLLGCAMTLLGYELTYGRDTTQKPRWALAAALMAVGTVLMSSMRIVALVPLVAIALDALWRTRHARAKWAALGVIAAVASIMAVVRLLDPRMSGGFHLLPKERELLELVTDIGPRTQRILDFTGAELLLRVTPSAMFGNRVGLWPVDLLISIVVIVTGVLLLRRRVAWGALAALSFAQWLLFFPDGRYFLPLLPLLVLAWWDMAVALAARLREARARWLLVATVALLCVPNALRDIGIAIEQHRTPFLDRYQSGRFRAMPELMAQAKRELPADSVLVADEFIASPLHYWSGLRTVTRRFGETLQPIPESRPAFLVLPTNTAIDADLLARGLVRGETVLEIPRGDLAPAAIVRLTPATPASGNR